MKPIAVTLAVLAAAQAAPLRAQGSPDLVRLGQDDFGAGDWLISEWPAGQSKLVQWSAASVRRGEAGVELVLEAAPPGADRPFRGGEIQSGTVARTGTWRWRARAPEMAEGAVFGLFLYRADHDDDPWREYDIEFVGPDTTEVQLNIHFETDDGERVTLGQARGGPVVVDLGFDAAEGFHDYEIEVTGRSAEFRADGRTLGTFGPSDMPGGAWNAGPLRAFADLWAVPPGMAEWAGRWSDPGRPLVAVIAEAETPATSD